MVLMPRASIDRRLAPVRAALVAAVLGVAFAAGPALAAAGHDAPDEGASRVSAYPPEASRFDEMTAFRHSQAAVNRVVRDQALVGADGRPLRLAELRGKPLLVSMVYTSCYHTCPLITRSLARAVEVAEEALGKGSFAVLTVGFDVGVDTPERMRLFAKQYGVGGANWRLASGDRAAIEGLAEDTGFLFFRTAAGFDHLAQTTLLDAEGRVVQQIYGDVLEMPAVVEPLKRLVFGTDAPLVSVDTLVKKVKLFCTVYDPATDRYRFDYSIFIGMGISFMIIGVAAAFVIRNWRAAVRRDGQGPAGRAA
jgi:protein SCO1/2